MPNRSETKVDDTQRDPCQSVLVATIPRSGTWYNNLFFHFYFQILCGQENMFIPPGLIDFRYASPKCPPTHIILCHAACPGFENYQGKFRQAWDELQFHGRVDCASRLLGADVEQSLNPQVNKDVKIVCVYRNPLDQGISGYQHLRGHNLREKLLKHTNQAGETCTIQNAREFFFVLGLESYIKQFFTYKVMMEVFPEVIMMVPYEKLIRFPHETFVHMLCFMGQDVNNEYCQRAVHMALDLSSVDSVKRFEKSMGHSLAGDQEDPTSSHVKDGRIGKWKEEFESGDLEIVQTRFAEFGIPMDLFVLE